MAFRTERLPRLPDLIEQKLTKTGYTRGASKKEIYQNRVTRNNPVLIPWEFWSKCRVPDDGSDAYENGFIVLVEPSWYFSDPDRADEELGSERVELGVNALLIFRRRLEWDAYRPQGCLRNGKEFTLATGRRAPLGGVYFVRTHATVAEGSVERIEGFASSRLRGAGIRVYEYASSDTIKKAKLQLEALLWLCGDSLEAMTTAGMSAGDAGRRRDSVLGAATTDGLLDLRRLQAARILGDDLQTMCPLCRRAVSARAFLERSSQAEGRETYDLTTTEISLFHIQELRIGRFQHKPYNLGWGHHFCNVVVKDAGIMPTLRWMTQVVANQPRSTALDDMAESVEQAVDG